MQTFLWMSVAKFWVLNTGNPVHSGAPEIWRGCGPPRRRMEVCRGSETHHTSKPRRPGKAFLECLSWPLHSKESLWINEKTYKRKSMRGGTIRHHFQLQKGSGSYIFALSFHTALTCDLLRCLSITSYILYLCFKLNSLSWHQEKLASFLWKSSRSKFYAEEVQFICTVIVTVTTRPLSWQDEPGQLSENFELVLVAWNRTAVLELPQFWEETPALAYLILQLVGFM